MARYLVVAHQTATTQALAQGLKSHTAQERNTEFVLLVPATQLKHLLVLHEGEAEAIARRNMELARDYLDAEGLHVVRGEVGAASPLVAIDEELRRHPGEYAGIFISTFPSNISRWLRLRLPSRVQRRFGLPVIHLVGRLDKSADAGLKWIEEHLAAVERGEADVLGQPLENIGFWEGVLRLAGSRQHGSAARQLLMQGVPPMAGKARVSAAIGALTSEQQSVRRAAINVLTQEVDPAVEAAGRQAIRDTDPQVRMGAIRVLEQQRTPSAAAVLIEVLRKPSDPLAPLAVDALVRLGAVAVPHLSELLASRSAQTRWRAAHCLARMETPEARQPLLKAFYDEEPSVAWAAAEGLAALGPSVGVEVVRSLLQPGAPRPQAVALRHYAEHAAPRQAFRPLLEATRLAGPRHTLPAAAAETLHALEQSRSRVAAAERH